MNLLKAWEQRDKLNEKMSRLLLQGLENDLLAYRRAIANYPPERMEKYGKPYLNMLEDKVAVIKKMIEEKFPN